MQDDVIEVGDIDVLDLNQLDGSWEILNFLRPSSVEGEKPMEEELSHKPKEKPGVQNVFADLLKEKEGKKAYRIGQKEDPIIRVWTGDEVDIAEI